MTTNRRCFCFVLSVCLLFELHIIAGQNQANTIDALADRIKISMSRHAGSPFVVGIGGCPGVGKTTLAAYLKAKFDDSGVSSVVLHLDDFNLSSQERLKLANEWDFSHLHLDDAKHVLEQIVAGRKSIHKSTYDQITGQTGSETLNLESTEIVIFEGLYTTCSQEPIDFARFSDLTIFMYASPDDVYQWKKERNFTRRTPRAPEEFERHMKAMFREYDENIAQSQREASIVISKTTNHEMNIVHTHDATQQ